MRNKQAIILLFTGNTLSGLATGITILAVPWYFAHFLEQPSLYGLGYAIITAMSFFWSLYAGTLIDRYSRKRIFQLSKLTCAVVIGGVSLSGFYLGYVPAFLALVASAVTFLNFNIHYPNLYAFGQEITEQKDFGKLNSYIEVQGQATNAIAGGLAAILLSGSASGMLSLAGIAIQFPFAIPQLTLHEVLALDAGTYFLSFTLVSFIRYRPIAKRETVTGSAFERIKTGLQFLRNRPNILLFGIFSNAIFVTVVTHAFFLLAMYVNDHLGIEADAFGSAEMVFAMGAIVAGLTMNRIYPHSKAITGIIIHTFIGAGLLWWLALSESVWVLMVFSLIYGLLNSGNRILRMTFIFNHIPNSVIGRSNSVFSVSGTLMRVTFIGLFSLPFFGKDANVIYAYMVLGSFLLIGAGLLIKANLGIKSTTP